MFPQRQIAVWCSRGANWANLWVLSPLTLPLAIDRAGTSTDSTDASIYRIYFLQLSGIPRRIQSLARPSLGVVFQAKGSFECNADLHNHSIWKIALLLNFPFHHSQQLRKNNFITDDNEVICSVKDFNDYRKYLHRRKLEAEAKAGENDECRLKLSKLLFGKLQRKKMKKFDEMYRTKNVGSDASWRATNPLGFTNIIKLKHKKLEQEQRRRIEK